MPSVDPPAAAGSPAALSLERFAARPVAVWLIAGLALGLRCIGLGKGLWLDDASSLDLVSGSADRFWLTLRAYDHPPAHFLLLRGLVLAGAGIVGLRLLSVACSVAAVVVLQRALGRRAPVAGLVAGLLVATLPPLLSISHELRPYALLLLATSLALAAALRLAEEPADRRARWALGGALGLAAATHAVGGLVAAPVGILVLGRSPTPNRLRAALAGVLPAAVLGGLWWGWLSTTPAKSAESWWVPALTPRLAARVFAGWIAPPELAAESRWTVLAGRVLPALALAVVISLALLVVRRRHAALALGALAYLFLLATISWLSLPVFLLRTTLPALPFAIAFLAMRTADLPPAARRAAVALTLVAAAGFATRWTSADAGQPIEPWREALAALGVVDGEVNPAVVYPSYLAPMLRQVAPRVARRSQLLVPLAAPPSQAAIESWLGTFRGVGSPPPLRLLARVDLSTAPWPAEFARLARRLESARGERGLDALLIVARDATVAPQLELSRDAMADALIEVFGAPAERLDERRYVVLRFPPRSTIAP